MIAGFATRVLRSFPGFGAPISSVQEGRIIALIERGVRVIHRLCDDPHGHDDLSSRQAADRRVFAQLRRLGLWGAESCT